MRPQPCICTSLHAEADSWGEGRLITRCHTSMIRRCRARTMNLKEGLSAGLCDQQASMSFCMPAGMLSGSGGR